MSDTLEKRKIFKNSSKKILKIFVSVIFVLFIISLIILIFLWYRPKVFLKQNLETNYTEQDKNLDADYSIFQDKLENLKKEFQIKESILEEKIENFEKITYKLQEKINNLEKNIINIENINPTNNEINLQIVILLYKIQDIVYKGGDFSKYLDYLLNLTKNRELISDCVLKLEKYKNQKSQKDIKIAFSREYLNILSLKGEKNRIKAFLDDNIKIRKVSDLEKDVDATSLNISNIEDSIEKFDYQEAINLITKNDYSQYFVDTLNILNEKNDAIFIINQALDFLYMIEK